MTIRGDHNVVSSLNRAIGPGTGDRVSHRRKARAGDAVEISKAARNLRGEKTLGSRHAGRASGADGGASVVRTQIRQRVRTGFYESEEVLRQIADRLVGLFGF